MADDRCPGCNATVVPGDRFCNSCGKKLLEVALRCNTCGTEARQGSRFCSSCGKPFAATRVRCPSCGKDTVPGAVCDQCGKSLEGEENKAGTAIDDHRWARAATDFAARVSVEDVPGFFRKELIVEGGTKALLMIDGAFAGELAPGRYDLVAAARSVPLIGRARSATAVLVEEGDVLLRFDFQDVPTSDPLRIGVSCEVRLKIQDLALYFRNFMKGNRRSTLGDLRLHLLPEIRNALFETIRERSTRDLSSDLSLKKQIEVRLESHLRTTLERIGLILFQVRTFDYFHERWDERARRQERFFLLISEKEAENQNRKRLFSVIQEGWVQYAVEEGGRIDNYVERARLYERLARAENTARMDQFKSRDDWEAFKHEMDQKGLLRKEEWEQFVEAYEAEREDRASARKHARELAQVRIDEEFHKGRIAAETSVRKADLLGSHELKELALRKEKELKEIEVELTALVNASARQEDLEKEIFVLDVQLRHAKNDAEIESIRLDLKRKKMDLGLYGLERVKAIKHADQRFAVLLDLEKKEGEARIRILEMEATARVENQRLEALAKVGTEVLVHTADTPEKAKLLAMLKRTEVFKGMSEEQITAATAAESAPVAEALKELFKSKGLAATEVKEVLERLLKEKDDRVKDANESAEQRVGDMKEMTDKAFSFGKEVLNRPPQAPVPPVIVASGGGGYVAPAQGFSPQQTEKACPKCGMHSRIDARFCAGCSYEYPGMGGAR